MLEFFSDLASAALVESGSAAGIGVVLALGACCSGLLGVPERVARPVMRALAGFPLFFIFGGSAAVSLYLLGGTVGSGLALVLVAAAATVVLAIWRDALRRLLVPRELLLLAIFLLCGFVLAFFGWGETADGTVRAMSGSWGDGPLHTLIMEAFVRRGGGDLSMPAFAGEQLREPFGYDFAAAVLRSGGFTVGGAFTLPAAGLLACLLAWAGHLSTVLMRRGQQEGSATAPRGTFQVLFPSLASAVLVLSFGGLQWIEMAATSRSWSPVRFFGVHAPVWDKAEESGLVWANHLNTFVSQRHLLLAAAFLLILVAMLLSATGRGGGAEEGTPPRGQTARGPSFGSTDRTRSVPGQNGWGIAADRRGWEEPPRQDHLGRLLPFAVATGLLPLFHMHAFLAAGLLWAAAFAVVRSRVLLILGGFALVVALPAVAWQSGLFSRSGFLALRPGWMAAGGLPSWVWFWVKNLGVFLPLTCLAVWRAVRRPGTTLGTGRPAHDASPPGGVLMGSRAPSVVLRRRETAAALLVAPALALFLLGNLVQFQPYLWDNFKIFLLAWVILLPLVVAEMARWTFPGARVSAVLLVLVMSLTTLSEVSTHLHFRSSHPVFRPIDRSSAQRLDARLPRDAVVLADTDTEHNHPLTLTGRTLASGYGGWIWTRNYAWEERLSALTELRSADPTTFCALARRLGITHIVDGTLAIHPVGERCGVSARAFRRFV